MSQLSTGAVSSGQRITEVGKKLMGTHPFGVEVVFIFLGAVLADRKAPGTGNTRSIIEGHDRGLDDIHGFTGKKVAKAHLIFVWVLGLRSGSESAWGSRTVNFSHGLSTGQQWV